jgi:hypothetical protein
MVVTMKMTAFWDDACSSLVEIYRHFRGSKYLWNAGKLLPDYTAQYSRRQSSSIKIYWYNDYQFPEDANKATPKMLCISNTPQILVYWINHCHKPFRKSKLVVTIWFTNHKILKTWYTLSQYSINHTCFTDTKQCEKSQHSISRSKKKKWKNKLYYQIVEWWQ